jgi:hypothetical protein
MGLHHFSSSSYDKPTTCGYYHQEKTKIPNPDPNNFEVIYSEQIGEYLIVKIKYPDCTNYEGIKILVYKGVVISDLLAQGSIDPHFSGNRDFYSPIARFVPTFGGLTMAKAFVNAMTTGKF